MKIVVENRITAIYKVLRVLFIGFALIAFVGSAHTPVEAGWLKKAKKAANKAGKDINKEAIRAKENVTNEANKAVGNVARETKRFGGDVNRELTKFENDYSREVRKFGNDIARETRGLVADAQAQSQRGISFGSFKLGENLAAGQGLLGYNLTRGERNLTHNIDRGMDGVLGNVSGVRFPGGPFGGKVAGVYGLVLGSPFNMPFLAAGFNPAARGNVLGGLGQLYDNVDKGVNRVGDALRDEGDRARDRVFGSPKVTDLDKSDTGTLNSTTSREPYPDEPAGSSMTSTTTHSSKSSSLPSMESGGSGLSSSGVNMNKGQTSSSISTSKPKTSGMPSRRR